MVHLFSKAMTGLFDLLTAPFGSNGTLALVVLSLLVGVGMIFVFKATSNQEQIRRTRDLFKGRILEMRIYQDDIVLIMKALGAAMATNVTYLRVSLKPIVVLVIIVIPIFIQFDERYARAPLGVDETTLFTVTLREGLDPRSVRVELKTDGGLTVDSRAVRVSSDRTVSWRLRNTAEGKHTLSVTAVDKAYAMPVFAQASNKAIGHTRTASSFTDPFFHPSLPMIPNDSPIESVRIDYPSSSPSLFGWQTHWLVIFMIFSLLGALIPKFLFGIQV